MTCMPPRSTLFPYTTLFRSEEISSASDVFQLAAVFWWVVTRRHPSGILTREDWTGAERLFGPVSKALQHSLSRRYEKDRKSTRLNSSHVEISYAVFCLKKKK